VTSCPKRFKNLRKINKNKVSCKGTHGLGSVAMQLSDAKKLVQWHLKEQGAQEKIKPSEGCRRSNGSHHQRCSIRQTM
jgi:hypothetical protein